MLTLGNLRLAQEEGTMGSMEKPHTKSAADQVAALRVIAAVAETIREVGEAPSGIIYTALSSKGVSFASYQNVIGILTRAKLIEQTPAHLLRWIGPTLEATS